MEYTKKITINVGDIVECLTGDGYLQSRVIETKKDSIVVFIEELYEETVEVSINDIRAR
jgi:hypothetical protein